MDKQQEQTLWEQYRSDPSTDSLNALVIYYLPLAEKVCDFLARKRIAGHDNPDELLGYAAEGLMLAIPTYDESKGAKPTTYLRAKVNWHLYDELRRTTEYRSKQRNEVLVMGFDDLQASDDFDPFEGSYEEDLDAGLRHEELFGILKSVRFSPAERSLARLLWIEGLNQAEASKALGKSEGWATHIKGPLLRKLKRELLKRRIVDTEEGE
jgi:RNA polymerase sigma factor (sigma-70 family)